MYLPETEKLRLGWCPNAGTIRTASTVLSSPPVSVHPLEPDGGAGSSGRIDRGINLAVQSIQILSRNKNLLWFSLLTGFVLAFLFIAQYALHLFGTYPYHAIDFPRWIVLTFAIDLVSVFCLTVLLAGLLMSISSGESGKRLSYREGLSRTKGYLCSLAIWSVFLALAGTALYVPLSNYGYTPFTLYPVLDQFPFNFILFPEVYNTGPIGGTYAMLSAVTFTIIALGINIVLVILTLFVVPLLVLENKRLPEAVGGSVSLMKKVWGEVIICFLILGLLLSSVSLTSLLFRVAYRVVAPDMLLFWYPGDAWIAGAVLFMLALCALAVIFSTIAGIAVLNIYSYGKTGRMSGEVKGK